MPVAGTEVVLHTFLVQVESVEEVPGHDVPPDNEACLRAGQEKNLEGGEYLADDAAVAVELAVVALSISLSVGALPVATEQITCWTS